MDSSNNKKLDNLIEDVDGLTLSVGFLGDQIHDDSSEQVGDIAEKQEFGDAANNIPIRSFMRPTIIDNTNEWLSMMIKGVKDAVSGKSSIIDTYNAIGEDAVFEVKQSIRAVTTPPLAVFTIKKRLEKGNTSDKPLIDTEQMIDSVNYEITK